MNRCKRCRAPSADSTCDMCSGLLEDIVHLRSVAREHARESLRLAEQASKSTGWRAAELTHRSLSEASLERVCLARAAQRIEDLNSRECVVECVVEMPQAVGA